MYFDKVKKSKLRIVHKKSCNDIFIIISVTDFIIDNASIGCNPSTTMANFVRAVNEMSKIYILDGGEITYLEDVLLILQRLLYLLPDAFEHLKKLEIELKLQV